LNSVLDQKYDFLNTRCQVNRYGYLIIPLRPDISNLTNSVPNNIENSFRQIESEPTISIPR